MAALYMFPSVSIASDLVGFSVEIEGWSVLPISDAGETTHLIAARIEAETLTTDIDVVLYERFGDIWTASAYDPSITKEDAMLDLSSEFGLSDPFLDQWLVGLNEENVLDFILHRVPFGKGFFVTDPLYNVAQLLDDPEPLVEGAEDAGLAAGSGAINTGVLSGGSDVGSPQPTNEDCIYISIAAGVDAYLSDPDLNVEDIELIAHDEMEAMICFCIEWTWRGRAGAWSSWTCTGWNLVASDPVAGTCTYSTYASRQRSASNRKRCYNCTVLNWTTFETQYGALTLTVPMGPGGSCSPPAACGAPQSSTSTGWVPPDPNCTWP